MKCHFYKWYSQALGATLGIIACIFGYLKGYMFVYSNMEGKFDFLGFDGIISSYLLLPLCILTLIFAIIRIHCEENTFLNISFYSMNKAVSLLTAFIGLLGTKLYFILPSILIGVGFTSYSYISDIVEKLNKNSTDETDNISQETNISKKHSNESKEARLLNTKRDIAIDLIHKGADMEFISDITGFSAEEIILISK